MNKPSCDISGGDQHSANAREYSPQAQCSSVTTAADGITKLGTLTIDTSRTISNASTACVRGQKHLAGTSLETPGNGASTVKTTAYRCRRTSEQLCVKPPVSHFSPLTATHTRPACRKVTVCARLRPLSAEVDQVIELDSETPNSLIVKGQNGQQVTSYQFDHVFGSGIAQAEVYQKAAEPLVLEFLRGFNASLLAYGQSGSGKTYTIEGILNNSIHMGIASRLARSLFEHIEAMKSDVRTFRVRVSIIEIYCERIRDLLSSSDQTSSQPALNPGTYRQGHLAVTSGMYSTSPPPVHSPPISSSLKIREESNGKVYLEGVTEWDLDGADHFQRIFALAHRKRAVGKTDLNLHSSRSHLIITFHLTQESRLDDSSLSSKIHLVDLAGSERASRSKSIGVTFDEAKHINLSLSALGNVVSALAQASSQKDSIKMTPVHIPYRDSKLTRLLADSLGGTSLTTMVVCLVSATSALQESLVALRFGQQSRQVLQQVSRNLKVKVSAESVIADREVLANLTSYILALEELIKSMGLPLPVEVTKQRAKVSVLFDAVGSPRQQTPRFGQRPWLTQANLAQFADSGSKCMSDNCSLEDFYMHRSRALERRASLARVGSSEKEHEHCGLTPAQPDSPIAESISQASPRASHQNEKYSSELPADPLLLSPVAASEVDLDDADAVLTPKSSGLLRALKDLQELAQKHALLEDANRYLGANLRVRESQVAHLQVSLQQAHEQYDRLFDQYEKIFIQHHPRILEDSRNRPASPQADEPSGDASDFLSSSHPTRSSDSSSVSSLPNSLDTPIVIRAMVSPDVEELLPKGG